MNGVTAALVGMVVIVAAVLGILAVSAIHGEVSTSCSAGQFANAENGTGYLGCATPAASGGCPSSCVTSLNSLVNAISLVNNDTYIGINNTVNHITVSLSSVPWSKVTSVPNIVNSLVQGSNSAIHGALSFINSTSIGIDQQVAGFKFKLLSQACPTSPQQYLKAIADTITCAQVDISQVSGSIVNSVSNSDGTLTISPTSGSVIASLALGHANIWTATQTINSLKFGGDADANSNRLTGILDLRGIGGNAEFDIINGRTAANASPLGISFLTDNNANSLVHRLDIGSGYAQGSAGITFYEPLYINPNPWYIISGSTNIFGLSSTGIQNTQGFQSVIAGALTNPSTSTTFTLPVAEPDTTYAVVCTPNFAATSLSVTGKSTTQFTVNYPAIAVGTDTVDCVITHQ